MNTPSQVPLKPDVTMRVYSQNCWNQYTLGITVRRHMVIIIIIHFHLGGVLRVCTYSTARAVPSAILTRVSQVNGLL